MKLRSTAALFAACLLVPTAASAAPGLAGATCSSPALMAFMQAHVGHGTVGQKGNLNPNRVNYGSISQSSLVSKTATSITCEITVSMSGRRGTQPLRGQFTTTTSSWHWQPRY